MIKEWEFNNYDHRLHLNDFHTSCASLRQYLQAQRVLGNETRHSDNDEVLVSAIYLVKLLDGKKITTAKKILAEAVRQLEQAHQVNAENIHSLLHGE